MYTQFTLPNGQEVEVLTVVWDTYLDEVILLGGKTRRDRIAEGASVGFFARPFLTRQGFYVGNAMKDRIWQ